MTGSPATEHAEIRRALTKATGEVAVDPVPQCIADPHKAGADADNEQKRYGTQCVGIPMNEMNDHGINIDEGPALRSRPRG